MTSRYEIRITLKNGILDNAGRAVTRALNTMGYDTVNDVRIGKTIYIETDQDPEPMARSQVNAVMEDYIIIAHND
jgi:phosphoribosylformylglycinamidine synthase subunit PurS|tara:strand:- start:2348 stop:2572 length:225 start_codon:yes stop_codon:yes gene_type:complete